MVKKVCLLILTMINLAVIGWILFSECDKYIYSRFTFNTFAFAINIIALIILDLFLVFAFIFVRKSKTFKSVALSLPIVAIAVWIFLAVSSVSVVGNFWKSETQNFAEFKEVDPTLDYHFQIADLRLSDIINTDIVSVSDFHYSYESRIGCEKFTFKGCFYFTSDDYEYLKDRFSSAKEFQEQPCFHNVDNHIMSGQFVIIPDIPRYESSTSVDFWETVKVSFSDEYKVFYFELIGECDT